LLAHHVVSQFGSGPLLVEPDAPDLRPFPLLDHLVGRRQQRFRDGEAERLGGFEVDHQLDLHYLLDRQISWFFALVWGP
jgi:hypothetical protein